MSSPVDGAALRARLALDNLAVLPNGVAPPATRPRRDDGRTLLFVGSLGYAPNCDALRWFVAEIWPRLRRKNLRLRVVGPNAPASLRRLGRRRGAEMLGWVADLRSVYETASLVIAPLRIGAGTRIKLIEAAMARTPIVSTSLGARGLELRDGRDLWLADRPAAFAAAIDAALDHPDERDRRARNARGAAARAFLRPALVAKAAAAFRALL